MPSDFELDGLIEYAYTCAGLAGWKIVDCSECGCPRWLKVNVLEECAGCGDGEKVIEQESK